MSTINNLNDYNSILNTSYDSKSIFQIKKLDNSSLLTINGLWKEYQEYFKSIDSTGITEETDYTNNTEG